MARMLRPSRPMIRPFISSLGSSISRVVVSLACVPASRPIAIERMLRARRSASRFVSSSIWMQDPARLAARILLDVGDQHLLGLGRRSARRAARAPCAAPASAASAPRPGRRGCARGRRGPARDARCRRASAVQPRRRGGRAPAAGRSPHGAPAGRSTSVGSLRPRRSAPRRLAGGAGSAVDSVVSPRRSRFAIFLLPRRSITMTMVKRRRPCRTPSGARRPGSGRGADRVVGELVLEAPPGQEREGPCPRPFVGEVLAARSAQVRSPGPARPRAAPRRRARRDARPIPRSSNAASIRSASPAGEITLVLSEGEGEALVVELADLDRARRSPPRRRPRTRPARSARHAAPPPSAHGAAGPRGPCSAPNRGSRSTASVGTAETAYAASGSDAGASGAGASGGAAISWAGVRVGPGARVTPRAS